ncbi:MAG: hypothetical protein QNJ05_14110 [Woeseiaceae bacterium]|nr:hypothetical protein [Woeseiaceae bacterium]
MNYPLRKMIVGTLSVLGVASITGCAVPGAAVDTASIERDAVIFGDLTLVTNGHEARLGDGLFAADAGIRLEHVETGRNYISRVGKNGQFETSVAPGSYRLHTIFFKHHGETIEASTDFVFTVSNAAEATYIGAIGLEASLDNGSHGVVGTADRFTVRNNCANVCDDRMAAIGLPHGDTDIALVQWVNQVAASAD